VTKHGLHRLQIRAAGHKPIAKAVAQMVKSEAVALGDDYASRNRGGAQMVPCPLSAVIAPVTINTIHQIAKQTPGYIGCAECKFAY
jgi:hypothetical protein